MGDSSRSAMTWHNENSHSHQRAIAQKNQCLRREEEGSHLFERANDASRLSADHRRQASALSRQESSILLPVAPRPGGAASPSASTPAALRTEIR